jgi:hypothetical protein
MNDFYILKNHIAIKAPNLETWARWMEDENHRRVARTEVEGIVISTVFLGLNHNFFSDKKPILFETMTFIEGQGEWQERCSTWAEAVLRHQAMCEKVEGYLNNSRQQSESIINQLKQQG